MPETRWTSQSDTRQEGELQITSAHSPGDSGECVTGECVWRAWATLTSEHLISQCHNEPMSDPARRAAR